MKIAVISDKKNHYLKKELFCFLSKEGFEVIKLKAKKPLNILDGCKELVQAFKNNLIDRAIVIDDYAIASFMFLAKHPSLVVAQISDEHSAMMTADHNGSNILTFASQISTIEMMKSMSVRFLNKQYSGGRHQSRIDMLNKLLSKEAL